MPTIIRQRLLRDVCAAVMILLAAALSPEFVHACIIVPHVNVAPVNARATCADAAQSPHHPHQLRARSHNKLPLEQRPDLRPDLRPERTPERRPEQNLEQRPH